MLALSADWPLCVRTRFSSHVVIDADFKWLIAFGDRLLEKGSYVLPQGF
jgi:hypothetical protein